MLTDGGPMVRQVTKPTIGMTSLTKTVGPTGGNRPGDATPCPKFDGGRFKDLRRLAQLSHADVAELVGCDRRQIGRWESSCDIPNQSTSQLLLELSVQFSLQVAADSQVVRRCSTCRMELAPSAFAVDQSRRDGRQRQCKRCKSEYGKRWRVDNAAEQRTRQAVRRTKQRPKPSGRAATPRKDRAREDLKQYGVELQIVNTPPRETLRNPSLLPGTKNVDKLSAAYFADCPTESDETLRSKKEEAWLKRLTKLFADGRLSDDQIKAFGRLLNKYWWSPSWTKARGA
jgi:hypothetical protein